MTSLKLITTKNFGDLQCSFYRNINDDILLTRKQIGTALEYKYPDDALSRIHKKHKNRLDLLSVVVKLTSTDGKEYDTTLYSQRGIMEICRWSNKPKANQFMDWVWDIIERYRNKELIDSTLLSSTLNKLSLILDNQEERISKLESQLTTLKQIEEKPKYRKPYNPWFAKMQPKYQLLEDYFNITRGQLFKNILKEMENIYCIDTNQIQADHCYENNIESCYPLEPYEFVPKYRDMIESIVNDNLIKYKITSENDPIVSTRHTTIFDTPVPEIKE